jgi:predicted ABC-type transport system involved in lysophospholipase L1 biosynthesis ATPase subunit
LTIVLVTHDANVGAQCERLISMSDGLITSDDAQVVEVPELVGAR